jgi:hypothetical protein
LRSTAASSATSAESLRRTARGCAPHALGVRQRAAGPLRQRRRRCRIGIGPRRAGAREWMRGNLSRRNCLWYLGGLYLKGHLGRCCATPSASFGSRGLSNSLEYVQVVVANTALCRSPSPTQHFTGRMYKSSSPTQHFTDHRLQHSTLQVVISDMLPHYRLPLRLRSSNTPQ